jgi:hypothetical protein
MKLKIKHVLLVMGLGVGIFKIEGHKMVCIAEKVTTQGIDQRLACKYHWSTRTSDGYNCYVQFQHAGTRIAPFQSLQFLVLDPHIYGFIPVQAGLKIVSKPKTGPVRKDNGDFELTTGGGSPAIIMFSDPFDKEHFMNLNKANSNAQLYNTAFLKNLIGDLEFANITDDLYHMLPCLGCVDRDAECNKK